MWIIQKLIHKGKYDYALVPNHPKATKNGYVLYHRVVMENHLGRLLLDSEEVHHIDENTHNNNISNLQVMKSGEHQRHHGLLRGKTYARIKCPNCGNVYVKLKKDSIDKKQYNCSRKCGRLFQLLSKTEQEERIKNCILEIFK